MKQTAMTVLGVIVFVAIIGGIIWFYASQGCYSGKPIGQTSNWCLAR
jgi:hypothetical protein